MGARRDLLIAALALLGAGCARERPGLAPRHVFLLTVEHLRADRCSFLMHDRPTTWMPSDETMRAQHRAFSPDDLAAEGVVFARCYAPSPLRDVSLATLHTGRPPLEHAVVAPGDLLPARVVTLAEAFRAAGFVTAAFLGGPQAPASGLAQGFDVQRAYDSDFAALSAAVRHLGRDPGSDARMFTWVHLVGLAPPWAPRAAEPDADALLAGRVFHPPGRPRRVDGAEAILRAWNAGELEPDAGDRADLCDVYDRELARLTAQIWLALHRAFDFHTGAAEASETWARTAFVLAGVNGVELGDAGAVGAAGRLSDAVLHVPLVLRHPDSLTGERIFADVVGLEDVAPTLLDWFGLPPLPGARGRSLLAVTDAHVERPFPERPAFAQLPERALYTARDARWRLVWNPLRAQPAGRPVSAGPLPELVLHDLEADPAGRRDVAAAEPEVVARLQAQIRAWREAQTVIEPADPRPIRPAALQR